MPFRMSDFNAEGIFFSLIALNSFLRIIRFLRTVKEKGGYRLEPAFLNSIQVDYFSNIGKLKFAMIGAKVEATSDITVIRVLIDGPAVSLNGSPTVSPMTPAL